MNIHPYYFSSTKRSFDALLAAVLLIVLAPLLLLIAALALITAGAPILFRQKRTGQNGRVFLLYKFRTMEKNAAMLKPKYHHLNEAPAPMFKIHNDPRFVGVGKWLARAGLDELPQLWNILKGEMSFVGPRPLPPSEIAGLPVDWRAWRERVRPGIFSKWALSEKKHTTLKNWQALEEETVQSGGLAYEIALMQKTFYSQLRNGIKLLFTSRQ